MSYGYSNAPFRAGTAISQGEGGFFGGSNRNERAGDFTLTTGTCNQRILIGNVRDRVPCVVVDSNSVTVSGQVQSTSLRLVMGDEIGAAITGPRLDAIYSSNISHYASNQMVVLSNAAFLASNQFPFLSNAAYYASNQYPSLSNAAFAASNLFAASRTFLETSNLSASNAVVAGTLSASNVSTAALSASNAWVAGDARVTGTLTTGGLTVDGDLVINGSNVVANAQQVVVRDNIMVLNSGEVGAGVSAGQAGIRIDRGTACNVDLVFDEMAQMFRVGTSSGALETIATRPWVDDSVAPFRDAAYYASNQVPAVSNAAYYASNQVPAVSNAAYYASNLVPAVSNAAFYASNQSPAVSNAACYASNLVQSLSNAVASGFGVFGLSTSTYGAGMNQLSFGTTQFASRITNNGNSIALLDAGVYTFMVKLNSDSVISNTLSLHCRYWDGASWVTYQSFEDTRSFTGQSDCVAQFMVQSSANQTWAIFFNNPTSSWAFATGSASDWWSRWMVYRIA